MYNILVSTVLSKYIWKIGVWYMNPVERYLHCIICYRGSNRERRVWSLTIITLMHAIVVELE